MSENDITYLTNSIASELIPLIMEEVSCSRIEAMDKLYNSNTYRNLINPATGLYYQSTLYVFEYLKDELKRVNKFS